MQYGTQIGSLLTRAETQRLVVKDLISGYVRADGKGYFDEINPDEFRLDGAYKSEVRDSVLVRYFYEECLVLEKVDS